MKAKYKWIPAGDAKQYVLKKGCFVHLHIHIGMLKAMSKLRISPLTLCEKSM
jgi:hypothetical protein